MRVEQLAEGVTLYLADCREVLPTLGPVDAVICDPPYGIGFTYESHDDSPEAYPAFMREIVGHVERLRGDGPAVFWQAMLNADRWHQWFPPGFRLFAACRGFIQYRATPIQFSWDPVIFWGKPNGDPSFQRRDWHAQRRAPFGVWGSRDGADHPCARPLEQVEYVVNTFSTSGDCVLDCFMGSGTTGVAAVRLGRQFTGIEIEPAYFDTACRRVEAALATPSLFIERHAPLVRPSLFETVQ